MRHDLWSEPLRSHPDEPDRAPVGPHDDTDAAARSRRVAMSATALITAALIVAVLAPIL